MYRTRINITRHNCFVFPLTLNPGLSSTSSVSLLLVASTEIFRFFPLSLILGFGVTGVVVADAEEEVGEDPDRPILSDDDDGDDDDPEGLDDPADLADAEVLSDDIVGGEFSKVAGEGGV